MSAHGTRNRYSAGCSCRPCKDANAAYHRQLKATRPPLAADDPRHGTVNGYSNRKCRCSHCTEAWRVYFGAWLRSHPEQVEKAALRHRLRMAAKRKSS